jgi:uncharacterized phage protein gp47/JayE
MPTSLEQLTTPDTQADVRAALFAYLAAAGFPVTSWREGDVARTLVESFALALANQTSLRAKLAAGGLLREAEGDWLSLLASQVYDIDRNAAHPTAGVVLLAAAAGAGPYSIAPGQLWFASSGGLRYQSSNAETLTLAQGGTLQVSVQAEAAGQAYNVANGAMVALLTPLAGVTVTNPDPGSGTWITSQGTDEENDASLVARCAARWPESGYGSPAASYDLWARNADATITRTNVVADAAGPNGGGVTVYVAGPSGPVGGGAVTAAQTAVNARAPLTAVATVVNASALAITVTATLYGKAQFQTSATAAATAALQALIAATAIGGKVYKSSIIAALMSATGVENATVAAPAGDTSLTAAQVATLTATLSWSNT